MSEMSNREIMCAILKSQEHTAAQLQAIQDQMLHMQQNMNAMSQAINETNQAISEMRQTMISASVGWKPT